MAVAKVIYLHNEVKPWTRSEIRNLLSTLESKKAQLSGFEQKQLEMYRDEFEDRDSFLNIAPVRYSDSKFILSGIIRSDISYRQFGDINSLKRSIGISFYGSYDKWFNAYIDFSDAGETGDFVDDSRAISPDRYYDFFDVDNGIEYSDIIGGVVLDMGWGNFAITKDYHQWGNGREGNLILSDKVASYPAISLTLKPVEWFRFYYMHGWLNSGVIDSSSVRTINSSQISSPQSYEFISKYIAVNMATVTINRMIDISVGNSIVYWGDLRPEMFVPFMFFKYLDRDTGKGVFNDGNGQVFLDLSLYYPKNYNFYATIFFDVLSTKALLGDLQHAKWLGVTFGAKRVGLFGYPVDLFLEYTRISPWVYEHKDDATTYKHLDATLGHWIGQNADHLNLRVNYYPKNNILVSLYSRFVRKGGLLDIYYAYNGDVDESFLYGENYTETRFGVKVIYDILPYFSLEAEGAMSDISDELPGRVKDFYLGNNTYISIGASFGIR
ncbi:MAG: hypothetical protein SCALA702_33630 [Melioribacteraceae bacterium]|nr:MAG: hypothetical protein SCALA702_33630 [Melioribacteraceae bacterium]